MTIWFASGNRHKKEELAAILRGHQIRLPAEAGIDFDPPETGNSFAENALIKARELYRLLSSRHLMGFSSTDFSPTDFSSTDFSRDMVIADDSGLCVDALGGRPGIYSARYAGPASGPAAGKAAGGEEGAPVPPGGGAKLGDARRNALLLQELGDNPRRSARFVCAMVLFLGEDRFFIAQETLEGELIREGRGSGGFGYDPILYLPEKGCTVAELTEEEKNRISHRGKAGRIIARVLADG
jgi:XTP/dITP diphosphohydrolase